MRYAPPSDPASTRNCPVRWQRRPAVDVTRDGLVDVKEAARHLGLSPSTVYKRAASIELASVKLGGRLLFRPADLDGYTEARRRTPERVRETVAAARRITRKRQI